MPAGPQAIAAGPDDVGRRLDVFLAARLPDLSRSEIQRLIRGGHVRARGAATVKSSQPVTAGLIVDVDVPPPAPADPTPEALPLAILFDDADIVVVDKPAGMVVHPAAGHAHGTLVNALLHHIGGLSGVGGRARPGIVHRLDRGTSGVMVIAKHDRAHRALARQFHDRAIGKEYVALVWGAVAPGRRIEQPIGRDPRQRQKMSGRAPRARAALTTIERVERLGPLSLVHVTIGTGRTHQIRVHLSEIGHPVVGDAIYGGVHRRVPPEVAAVARLARPFLHARRLTFAHPADGRRVSFEAPLPPDLADVLERVRARTAPADT